MKHIIFSVIFFNILFCSIGFSQSGYVAKIGDEVISLDEFKERYELTPKIKSDYNNDSTKIQFLYSIIAEELWALEAESLSMDTVAYVYNSTKNIERKLVKDKLYKTEIEEKVQVTDDEILKNLPKLKEKRVMNFLYSESKKEIYQLYEKLKLGVPFDSLLLKRAENKEQTNGITTTYGEMDNEIEDKIFSLKINQFTEPIKLKRGWGIYYLKKIELNISENIDNRKRAEEILSARKAKKLYNSFFNKYIKGKVINNDKELFIKLRNEIYKLLKTANEDLFFNKNEKTYQLSRYQIKKIASNFSNEELESSFIKFKISPISLKNYLLSLELNDFKCKKLSLDGVESALRKNIKAYIFEELLVREGYSRGLQNSDEIKKELRRWNKSFLASYYRHLYLDSVMVSNQDAKKLYNKIILENGNATEKSFKDVKDLIKKGLYFYELEELYTNKTISLAEKYGFEIDYKELSSLNVTEVEMLVYRVLGFGGKITAVPYLQPFYKWKNWLPKSLKNSYKE
jgi:hypothetical protein